MRKLAVLSSFLLLFLSITASADVINIPADYATIQQGIDAGSDGDTVLVHPGNYVENLDFGEHNITLGSLFLTTGDTSYISQTVIDGDSAGSVVIFGSEIDESTILTGFTITNGLAATGGAIMCSNGAGPVIRENYIRHNSASARGGGVFCDTSSGPRISYNVFNDNYAQYGGGAIYLSSSQGSYIGNNLFYSNVSQDGGAICSRNSNFILLNNTITRNHALSVGGGIYCWDSTYVELENTVIWDNYAGNVDQVYLGITTVENVSYCNIQGGWDGLGNIDTNPLFRNIEQEDFHLMSTDCGDSTDSPCIDAGFPGVSDHILNCSWGLGGDLSDIGAFGGGESNSGPGRVINVPDNYASIQAAILASWHGDTVLVQPGTYVEFIDFLGRNITLGSRFILTGDTTYIDSTVITTELPGSIVRFVNGEDSTAKLTGFTIQGGHDLDHPGGGIYISYSSPIISDNIIEFNQANGGGGIYCTHSDAKIIHNKISDNTVIGFGSTGAGLICRGPDSRPTIAYNEIRSNQLDGAAAMGGGAFFQDCEPVIYNNNICFNSMLSVGATGAGVYFQNCDVLFKNNRVFQNSAPYQPRGSGGIEFYGTNGIFDNNIVINNQGASYGGLQIDANTVLLEIRNSIIRGNIPLQITTSDLPHLEISYCDIQDTLWPGEGNIDLAPLFRDPDNEDFHLMSTACGDAFDSPCIDAGDPIIIDSLLDCAWGLGEPRSDMGAYGGGDSLMTGITEHYSAIPGNFMLLQNYPNPFNAQTTIRFVLPESQNVKLTVYDLLGRQVEVLIDNFVEAGIRVITFDATDLPSGLYFYKLQAAGMVEVKKMVLIK